MSYTSDFRNKIFGNSGSLELAKNFKRRCPTTDIYKDRLAHELNLINKKKFGKYLLRALTAIKKQDNLV